MRAPAQAPAPPWSGRSLQERLRECQGETQGLELKANQAVELAEREFQAREGAWNSSWCRLALSALASLVMDLGAALLQAACKKREELRAAEAHYRQLLMQASNNLCAVPDRV